MPQFLTLLIMSLSLNPLIFSAHALDPEELDFSVKMLGTTQKFGAAPGAGCFSEQSIANTPLTAFEKVCGPLGADKGPLLAETPAAFTAVASSSYIAQDENPGSYENYPMFAAQLEAFLKNDLNTGANKSRSQACQWLFWKDGSMRRPYSGTLCAIGKNSAFIKKMAAKHGIPPEFLACTIGGDSMLYTRQPDVIAQRKHGPNPLPAEQYVFDLVKPQAFGKKHPNYAFESSDETEQLIERMAVIGREGKEKYLAAYAVMGHSNLQFGNGPEHEAAILSTIYNIGADQLTPNVSKNPGLNYFGLSCARMMKIYKKHLNRQNPSSAACL